MKKLLIVGLLFALVTGLARAQNSSTQQQLDVIMGKLQDLQEAQTAQNKRLEALEHDLKELSDKVNNPPVVDNATRDDLRKLAEQVQTIDQKRQDDKALILKNIQQLANFGTDTETKPHKADGSKTPERPESAAALDSHEYLIQKGDMLSVIVKMYRDQGIKITQAQLIAANPKINPDVLIPGKKLVIPDPDAK